jgi:hypothetical protein
MTRTTGNSSFYRRDSSKCSVAFADLLNSAHRLFINQETGIFYVCFAVTRPLNHEFLKKKNGGNSLASPFARQRR